MVEFDKKNMDSMASAEKHARQSMIGVRARFVNFRSWSASIKSMWKRDLYIMFRELIAGDLAAWRRVCKTLGLRPQRRWLSSVAKMVVPGSEEQEAHVTMRADEDLDNRLTRVLGRELGQHIQAKFARLNKSLGV